MKLAAGSIWTVITLISVLAAQPCLADVVSDFSEGSLQDWVVIGDATGPTNPRAGGNPGGYMRVYEPATGGACWAIAPAEFLGSWQDKASVSADLIQIEGVGLTGFASVQFQISGPGGRYTRNFGNRPPAYWRTYTVALEEAKWTRNSGTWAGLLNNVTDFRILVEFVVGSETTGLDNVKLIDKQQTPQLPTILEIKQMPDGKYVQTKGVVSRTVFSSVYIQSEDGAAGIWVYTPLPVSTGDRIAVAGTLATIYRERLLKKATLLSSEPGDPPTPQFVAPADFGGVGLTSYDPKLGSSLTPKETGLLVWTSGEVAMLSAVDGTFRINSAGGSVVGVCDYDVAIPIPGSAIDLAGLSVSFGNPAYPAIILCDDEVIYRNLPLGKNLIRNAGGEEGLSSTGGALIRPVAGWIMTSGFTVTNYGYIYPTAESQRIGGGRSFFFGGINTAQSEAVQDIDVSSLADLIDARKIIATLSGYLGGRDLEKDYPTVIAVCYNAGGSYLGGIQIGGTAATSNNVWNYYEKSASVPPGTRRIQVKMIAVRIIGRNADGFFDNLSLVLTSSQ